MAISVNGPTAASQTLPPQQLDANARYMQREALKLERREHITTKESKERRADYVPLDSIKRRVDQAGTEENLAARGENRVKLKGWTTAWKDLEDDGTADQSLNTVNEGLGQTHRGKLQSTASSMHYTPEVDNFYQRGGRKVRQGRGEDHGANIHGRSNKQAERSAPVKRSRVVKGGTSPVPVKGTPPMQSKEPLATQAASSTTSLGQQTRRGNVPNVTKAAMSIAPHRPIARTREPTARERARANVTYAGHLATPDAFMTSIQREQTTQATTPQPVEQSKHGNDNPKAATTPDDYMANIQHYQKQTTQTTTSQFVEQAKHASDSPKAVATLRGLPETDLKMGSAKGVQASNPVPEVDLMDLDVGSAAPDQPVIGFTDTSDSAAQADEVPQGTAMPVNGPASPLSSLEAVLAFTQNIENLQATGYLTNDLLQTLKTVADEVDARAKAERANAEQARIEEARVKQEHTEQAKVEQAKSTSFMKLAKASTYTAGDIMALRPKTASPPPRVVVTERAPQLPREKTKTPVPKRTVLPTPENSLLQAVAQRLKTQRGLIVGEHVYRTRFQRAQSISETEESHRYDDVSSKPAASNTGPTLPSHVASLAPITDDGAAMRTHDVPTGEASSKPTRTGPQLPPHLVNKTPSTDPGAAARAQYSAKTVVSSQPSRPGPQLPAHLLNWPTTSDPGAAARIQYGGTTEASAKASRSGPGLPPHLANKTPITDPGAAARAQYGSAPVASDGRKVLSPLNGQLRSPTLIGSAVARPALTNPKPHKAR